VSPENFGKKRYGRFYGLTNVAVGAGSVAFNAMASSLYHGVGHTIDGPDGVQQFVCSGGGCFQSTFGTAAALCFALALLPTLVLLWVSHLHPAAAKESLALQVGKLWYRVEGARKRLLQKQCQLPS
jgi:hypothetical protein